MINTALLGSETSTNSKDSNEMPHNAAFHWGLHCLQRQNLRERNSFFLKEKSNL